MKPPDAANHRLAIIDASLACFRMGWLSLLPLIGLPFGFLAVRRFRLTFAISRGEWNPARAYLLGGYALGILGMLLSLGEGALAVLLYFNQF